MTNERHVFGFIVSSLCLSFMGTCESSAELPQSNTQSVWPALSSAQYYWYEPQTGLSVEQADAIFREVTTTEISLMMHQYPNQVVIVKSVQAVTKKTKKGEKTGGLLKLENIWEGYNKPFPTLLELDSIQKMDLYYVSKAKNKWLLRISGAVGSFEFFFKDEDSARNFGNAVASILAQQGINLKSSRLGLLTVDLTPQQAEALGKTRIDNVLVTLVAIDGPADKADIQPLDVITDVNGVKVRNDSHFHSIIEDIASGAKVTLTCLRRTEVEDKGQNQVVWKPKVFEVTVE